MDLDTFLHPCIYPDHVSSPKIEFIYIDTIVLNAVDKSINYQLVIINIRFKGV